MAAGNHEPGAEYYKLRLEQTRNSSAFVQRVIHLAVAPIDGGGGAASLEHALSQVARFPVEQGGRERRYAPPSASAEVARGRFIEHLPKMETGNRAL